YWAVKPHSGDGWVELGLSRETLVYGLDLGGYLGNGNSLVVEYRQKDGFWTSFLGGTLSSLPLNGLIDLSYERIVTERIRLHIRGANPEQARLNEIKLKAEATDKVFYRINPHSVEASEHTSYLTRADFLTDGNTNTYWMVKPRHRSGNNWLFETIETYMGIPINYNTNFNWSDRPPYYNYGEVVFDLNGVKTITNINIYFSADTRGDLTVESQIGGVWQKNGFIPEMKQSGWYRLDLTTPVNTSKIRLTMEATGHESVGGISEVEFWGYGAYAGYRQIALGPQIPQALTNAINHQFELKKEAARDYRLDFAVNSASGETLAIELNGKEYLVEQKCNLNEEIIYSLPLTNTMLDNEYNYLRIKPQTGISTGIKLTHAGDGIQPHQASALNDGLVLTPGTDSAEQIINFNQKTLVEQIEIYTTATDINISYKNGNKWMSIDPANVIPGIIRFNTSFNAEQIKLVNPSRLQINEVRVLGSPVTDQAPTVRFLRPEDFEVFDCDQLSDKHLVGFVDNPQAKVKVNGKEVFQIGQYFGCHLTAIGIPTWEETEVEAVATDPEGRVGRYKTSIIIDKLPWFTIDQTKNTVTTSNGTYHISGEVKKPHCVLKVNGQIITEQKGRFATQVSLDEGLNLIKIECVYTKPGSNSFTQTAFRKVVRQDSGIQLQVNTPLDGSRIAESDILVTGDIYGFGNCRVWVNGKAATVTGERFSASVALVEGKNVINVKAENDLGASVETSITIWRDTAPPLINITKPFDQSYSNTATVTVGGSITDASPVYVLVNGIAVSLDGAEFTTTLTLPENWNQVFVKAEDAAGNVTETILNVMVDIQAPLPFTPSANPSGWTNNNRPVISFATTDETSGVNHYEIRVGDGDWITSVNSPYQFANALPDGELTIWVKAVDKAGNVTIGEVKLYIDTISPQVPPNFRAVPGNAKMILRWEKPSEDTVEYRVERLPATEPALHSFSGNEYTDINLENGHIYTYRLWAIDHAGNVSEATEWKEAMVGLTDVPYQPGQGAVVEYENVLLCMPDTGVPEGIERIQVTEIESEYLTNQAVFPIISPIYEFGAVKAGETEPEEGIKFEKGYLARIEYDESKLPPKFPEQNLGVYYYNPMFDRWFLINDLGVDTENNAIYFITNHFSSFSVQITIFQDLAPDEYKDAGYSPLKSYSQHEGISISPQGGTASTRATEMVLPGRNGFDLTIARHYDTAAARSDAFSVAFGGSLGWDIMSPKGIDDSCENAKAIVDFYNKIKDTLDEYEKWLEWTNSNTYQNIRDYVEKFIFNQGDYAYSMGQGWRLNLPYVKTANSDLIFCTPDGGMHSLFEMNFEKGEGYTDGNLTYRTITFKQHEGDDFTITVKQINDAAIDVFSILTKDRIFRSRWYSMEYKITLRDGTIYELNGAGRVERIVAPDGINDICFEYDGPLLDYIRDSMGRKVKFKYEPFIIVPRITKIWIENDSYNRQVSYDVRGPGLLRGVTDVKGRVYSYDYDFNLLFGGTASFRVNVLKMVVKAILNAVSYGALGSLLGDDIVLSGNFQIEVVYVMDKMSAPGQGQVLIGYDKKTLTYGDSTVHYFKLFGIKIPHAISFHITLFQRILADSIKVYSYPGGLQIKRCSFSYDLEQHSHGKPYVRRTEKNDYKRKTIYNYSAIHQDRYSWNDNFGIGPFRIQEVIYRVDILPLNNSIEVRDASSGVLLELTEMEYDVDRMRVTLQTMKHGSNYQTISYAYDNWGNVTYTNDYSISNGRTNQTKTWTYYLLTNSTPSSEAPWLGSPFTQTELSRQRNNLPVGKIVANYTPAKSGGETVTYLHSYYQYNDLGQQTGSAQWSGSEWLTSQYEYHPTFGSIVKKTNPEGHQTVYEYDSQGLPAAVIEKSVINAAGATEDLITRTGYEYISGWKLWQQNPRGYVTQYQYDKLGRTTQITAPDDDDQPGWIPEGSQPSFRNNNSVTGIEYNDRELYSIVTDPLGNRTMYDFDQLGRMVKLIKYRRDGGQYVEAAVTDLTYDAWDNITAITDPNRNTTGYSYDALGRNTAITYPGGVDKTMSFDYNTNTLTILDENNHKTVEEHDMQGRVTKQTRYNKYDTITTEIYYDGLGNEVITIGPKPGVTTVKSYNQLNLLERVDLPQEKFRENGVEVTVTPYQRFTYNKAGQKVADIVGAPEGERTTGYEVDGLGRVSKTTACYTDKGEVKEAATEIYYDENGNKIKVVDANNTSLPKEQQKYFEYKYTAADLLEYEVDPAGNKTSYTYDKIGNRKSMTDPRGNSGRYSGDFTIIYDYDDLNRLVTGHLPALPGQSQKPEVHLKYDARGNLLERTEPDGMVTSYNYWPRNWVKSVTVKGDNTTYTTNHFYDDAGNEAAVQDARGNTTVKEYDALNRLIRVAYPEGNSEQFEYDESNNRTGYVNGRYVKTNYTYDKYNRLTQVKDGLGGTTCYDYDRFGNMTWMENALNHATTYKYDELNRLIYEKDTQDYIKEYRYDAVGNRIWSRDPNGTTSDYQYYPNNLVKEITLNNNGRTQVLSYQYDEAGYRTSVSNGAVVTTYNNFDGSYRPDAFGRIYKESKTFEGQTFTIEYQYDVMGRATGVKYPTGNWVNYEYNNLGQLTKVPGYIEEKPSYDLGGLLVGLKAANGVNTAWEYDRNGRLTKLGYANQGELLKNYSFAYDGANNIIQKNQDSFQYDLLNQLLYANLKGNFEIDPVADVQKAGLTRDDFKAQKPLEFSLENIEVIELDYAAGCIGVDLLSPFSITKVAFTPNSPLHRVQARNLLVYTSLDNSTYNKVEDWKVVAGEKGVLEIVFNSPVNTRFIKIKCLFDNRDVELNPVNMATFINKPDEIIKVHYLVESRQEQYVYDAVGNRTTETITQRYPVSKQYDYYSNSSRLKSNEKYSFEYDDNGNLVKKTAADGSVTWEYRYDLLNRLVKVTKNSIDVASYLYDESGLRLKKQGKDKAVYYVFDIVGNVLYEQENRDYLEYVYVLGKHFARIDGNLDNLEEKTKYFYHTDHLGSTVLVTDAAGQQVWSAEYTPFGKQVSKEGELDGAAKFTGKDLDEDIGLYYFNARWMDSETGRFISEDTAPVDPNDPRTLNFYMYCWNNPINYIDPTGNTPYIHHEYNRKDKTHIYSYLSTPRPLDLWAMMWGTLTPGFGTLGDIGQRVFISNKEITSEDWKKYYKASNAFFDTLSVSQYAKSSNISKLGKFANEFGAIFDVINYGEYALGYISQDSAKDQLVNELFGTLDTSTEEGAKAKYFFARGVIDKLVKGDKLSYRTNLFGGLSSYKLKNGADQDCLDTMMMLYDAQLVAQGTQSEKLFSTNWGSYFSTNELAVALEYTNTLNSIDQMIKNGYSEKSAEIKSLNSYLDFLTNQLLNPNVTENDDN
ncbi:MAG: hypothetical protein GXY86_14235, partial [Firmicutes bacterium]|nr:hypothetical protein [Bacillota bacterium]